MQTCPGFVISDEVLLFNFGRDSARKPQLWRSNSRRLNFHPERYREIEQPFSSPLHGLLALYLHHVLAIWATVGYPRASSILFNLVELS